MWLIKSTNNFLIFKTHGGVGFWRLNITLLWSSFLSNQWSSIIIQNVKFLLKYNILFTYWVLQCVVFKIYQRLSLLLRFHYDVTINDSVQSHHTIVDLSHESCDFIGHCLFLWRHSENAGVGIIFDMPSKNIKSSFFMRGTP